MRTPLQMRIGLKLTATEHRELDGSKNRYFLLIGTLTFCASIIINLPASLFSEHIDKVAQNLSLQTGISRGQYGTSLTIPRVPGNKCLLERGLVPVILGRLNLDSLMPRVLRGNLIFPYQETL